MRSPSDAPNSTSYTPGWGTAPEMQKSFGPRDPSVPSAANAAPPSATIPGMFTSVSMLLTAVGRPNSPDSTGNGGLLRGSPRFPPPGVERAGGGRGHAWTPGTPTNPMPASA